MKTAAPVTGIEGICVVIEFRRNDSTTMSQLGFVFCTLRLLLTKLVANMRTGLSEGEWKT